MSGPSLRAAIDAKCRNCGGQEGGERFWRVHTSACPVTACPLWKVRPLVTRHAPAWLASRDPARLPDGFALLSLEQAIAAIRGAGAVMHPETGGNSKTAASPICRAGGGAA